jgi:RNA polymerase-binding transcription factor DksA
LERRETMENQEMGHVFDKEIERLQREKAALVSWSRMDPGWAGDPCDRASNLIEQFEAGAKYKFLDKRCQQLMHAKARCEAGLAGVCDVCGKRIDPERLKVMSDATACVTCKQKVRGRQSGNARFGLQYG